MYNGISTEYGESALENSNKSKYVSSTSFRQGPVARNREGRTQVLLRIQKNSFLEYQLKMRRLNAMKIDALPIIGMTLSRRLIFKWTMKKGRIVLGSFVQTQLTAHSHNYLSHSSSTQKPASGNCSVRW